MAGDNQERIEAYLELEQFLVDLRTGQVAHLPKVLTPQETRVYRMALLFHAGTPGVSELRPAFAAHLQSQLAHELHELQHEQTASQTQIPLVAFSTRRVTRRMLLAGSAVAAASTAIGAGLEHLVGQTRQAGTNGDRHIAGSLTEWSFVTTVAELGNQAVQFASESLTGYVVGSDGAQSDQASPGQILALSAACTHLGCIVTWSGADRSFHCPCHDAVFTEDGRAKVSGPSSHTLPPLPRLDVQIQEGKIYVRIPASAS